MMESFPAVEGLTRVLRTIGTFIYIVGSTHITSSYVARIRLVFTIIICIFSGGIVCVSVSALVTEVEVTGQCSKVVHHAVDTEIVAVEATNGIRGGDRHLFVERHLTHTIDRIFGVIHYLWHTVLGTLHHHTATEHATEVGTLDSIQDTTGIDGAHTILFPISRIWNRI